MDYVHIHPVSKVRMQVLSIDVDASNGVESQYRILLNDSVKYITVEPGCYNGDTLSYPPTLLEQLPQLPPGDWTRARISRKSGVQLSHDPLAEVTTRWHPKLIDVLSLKTVEELNFRVQRVIYGEKTAVAKIARFDFEIPLVSHETAVFQAIEGHEVGPAFLGHLVEHGRIMGFLTEDLEGRLADTKDLVACMEVVRRLHSAGFVHGDTNRHNFIVTKTGVRLVDFENAIKADAFGMEREIKGLAENLLTNRGGVIRGLR